MVVFFYSFSQKTFFRLECMNNQASQTLLQIKLRLQNVTMVLQIPQTLQSRFIPTGMVNSLGESAAHLHNS